MPHDIILQLVPDSVPSTVQVDCYISKCGSRCKLLPGFAGDPCDIVVILSLPLLVFAYLHMHCGPDCRQTNDVAQTPVVIGGVTPITIICC